MWLTDDWMDLDIIAFLSWYVQREVSKVGRTVGMSFG